jgi:hypothetical protein
MPLKYSVPCLALTVLVVLALPVIQQRTLAMMHASLEASPDVLAHKGREIAGAMGYEKKPVDTYIDLSNRKQLVAMLNSKPGPPDWDKWLAAEAPVVAVYRESPVMMVAEPFGYADGATPPSTLPGMVYEQMDGHGWLRTFSAVPHDNTEASSPISIDAVFRAMGFDRANFAETTPRLVPNHASDAVFAWKGPHPTIPSTDLWVEIATWKGRVTQAQVEFPYDTAAVIDNSPKGWKSVRGFLMLASYGMAGFFGILMARSNWKKGRVDKKGALRLAGFYFILNTITWFGRMHPVPSDQMFYLFLNSIGESLLWAGMLWVLYLALEPAVRSRWPHALVTWNRILAGRWSDPQVGSHLLVGALLAAVATIVFALHGTWGTSGLEATVNFWPLLGMRQWFASLAAMINSALMIGLAAFFAIFGMRVLVKRDWLAAIITSLMFTFSEGTVVNSSHVLATASLYAIIYTALMFLLLRFGLVSTIGMIVFVNSMERITLGTDLRAWWVPYGLAVMAATVALAAYAFWRSIGSRDVIGE